MASISADWTEAIALTFDDATPAKTVEGVAQVDIDNLGYIKINVQLVIVFGGSADGDAEIRVRSSPDSGVTKDTILFWEQNVAFTVGTTKRISFVLEDMPYAEIGIYNGNTAVEDITISGQYAGLKYSVV